MSFSMHVGTVLVNISIHDNESSIMILYIPVVSHLLGHTSYVEGVVGSLVATMTLNQQSTAYFSPRYSVPIQYPLLCTIYDFSMGADSVFVTIPFASIFCAMVLSYLLIVLAPDTSSLISLELLTLSDGFEVWYPFWRHASHIESMSTWSQ
jgi:hypothetical protein